ncbi:MAG: NAD(P)/FAD-dependent oxidoreductase [Candidatus Omnitrophica bacterium]|nr:NAD(P)/FAD-dependent oxidoreductase [Candidatus Omnitrophota bacterium]
MSINIPETTKPRVVIIGAGFAGLELVKGLRSLGVQVVLIDQNNHHVFQPLLYQVATSGLEPESIAYPVREIFRHQKNFLFRMAEVLQIKPAEKCVATSIGDIPYDYLVVATGSKANFFGLKDMEMRAMCMKTIPDAMELRNMILESFEKAILTGSAEEQERLMTFVIIGGGPTGVELAGALGEMRRIVLPQDHPELDFKRMRICLVDMEDRLLKAMSSEASKSAERFLAEHGVEVCLGARVLSFDGDKVTLSNGKVIYSHNIVWAAGVMGAAVAGLGEGALAGGRIKTDVFNRVAGHENIFAIGDVACVVSEKAPRGHPMLAPVAVQQAKLLASNLRRILCKDSELKPFIYQDLGVMATVGKHHAVADLFFGKIQGLLAWMIWAGLHLAIMVGARNRIVTMINWTWSYFRYDSGMRLIIRPRAGR